jgi:alkylation response protein AidB-like acyl-CoA dehydrogenase
VDLSLSDEHRQLQELAHRFTEERIVPFAQQWDRDEAIDRALVPRLGEVGFLGLGIDEDYGGSGGDNLAYCLVLEEISYGCTGVNTTVAANMLGTMPIIIAEKIKMTRT